MSVEPYVEPPDTDPFGSCSRYMQCPADMVVVTAAPAQNNHVVIAVENSVPVGTIPRPRYRFVVTDPAGVQAGTGCAQLDSQAAACTAGAVGPVSSATVTTRSPPASVQVTCTVATDGT